MFQNIIKNISRFVTLTPEEENIYEGMLTLQKYPKKTHLLREGEICQFEGFIKQGCVRTYYLDENGFEVTLLFAVEDWWITDIDSFNNKTPSKIFIEALEDTEIYMLNPETKEELMQKVPKFERAFRLMMQRYVVTLQNRLVNTISQPATDRYLEFIRVYPSIPQRVAQYYIASYLGVSKEFVSTIRKRLANKEKQK
ncbi:MULTISPECIES: Crp/Fnr family transcriptional regulator [unclassified Chryseobacterium]|uniref:Crp/Fnr family transcriptional regulator n=1 Tax=unclassified Chryseobacterium TaxID=2593645 RepID=UPI00100AE1E4|nr:MULTISPECIES: Crp/Fnr family transcriptional regulator [unclassified Chryseobacterium]RXM50547.1 Crp/Fnr family transcriptional regulator [Chryseobacterium sp. CH25]RXM63181.1 Crp/Fnr family transcriptional regulator [Chryseobacterium sp. CH1]